MAYPTRYVTITDVEYQYVRPALGEFVEDYDTEAIAREVSTYVVDTDSNGNELLNTAGFELRVSESQFWEICEKHTH